MRFALQMESTGFGGDPSVFAEIAQDAEAAGWDGIFLSDPASISLDRRPRSAAELHPMGQRSELRAHPMPMATTVQRALQRARPGRD